VFDNFVTRFYPGATDSSPTAIFSDLYALDRTSKLIEYLNDFFDYSGPTAAGTSGGWILTGAGSAGLTAGNGGQLLLTSPVSTFQSLQKTPTFLQMASGYRGWGKIIQKLDSLLGNTLTGMVNVTAAPFTGGQITDGVWFTTDVTTGQVKGNIATAGTVQTVDLGVQIIAGQFYQLAWYYDGEVYSSPTGKVIFEVITAPNNGGVVPPTAGVTASARASITPIAANPAATLLAPIIAVNASTAVARNLTTDLFYVSQDRTPINQTPPF
jgi:hypothetical protein